jgi:hypothetical protein
MKKTRRRFGSAHVFQLRVVFEMPVHKVNLEESADKITLVALFYFGKLAHILVLGETVQAF